MKLMLIAGHHRANWLSFPPHGRDPGVVLRKGVEMDNEHWIAERLTLQAYNILKEEGYDIELCPFNYNLPQKIKHANKILTKRDIIVSVHMNGAISKQANGSEVFYIKGGKRSHIFAKNISKILSDVLLTKNRGHKPDSYTQHGRLGIIRDTKSYDFLLELGFMSNESDYAKVEKRGVEAILQACRYLLTKKA